MTRGQSVLKSNALGAKATLLGFEPYIHCCGRIVFITMRKWAKLLREVHGSETSLRCV